MMEDSSDGPKMNWVSFQGEMATVGGKLPTALLEPVEMNDIPLHDFDEGVAAKGHHPSGGTMANANAGVGPTKSGGSNSSLPPPLPPPPKPASAAAYYQKTPPASIEKREIILVPSMAATSGTSSSSSSSSNNAAPGMEMRGGGEKATEEFKNGKLLTTVFPSNAHCAWFVPPKYDVKMPSILANKHNLLPATTFADIIRTIGKDLRFFSYAVLYSRITPIWLIFSIIILLAVLASSPAGVDGKNKFPIMIFALLWLLMLVVGLALCVLIRKYIVLSLRNLFKEINKVTFQYRILVGVQDKGQMSCHKVALMFIFYDPAGCKEDALKLLRVHQINFPMPGGQQRQLSEGELAYKAEELVCQYSQEYAKAYMKKRFLFPTRPAEGVSDFRPKHCQKNLCICQYIEREHFNKSNAKKRAPWYERVFAV